MGGRQGTQGWGRCCWALRKPAGQERNPAGDVLSHLHVFPSWAWRQRARQPWTSWWTSPGLVRKRTGRRRWLHKTSGSFQLWNVSDSTYGPTYTASIQKFSQVRIYVWHTTAKDVSLANLFRERDCILSGWCCGEWKAKVPFPGPQPGAPRKVPRRNIEVLFPGTQTCVLNYSAYSSEYLPLRTLSWFVSPLKVAFFVWSYSEKPTERNAFQTHGT